MHRRLHPVSASVFLVFMANAGCSGKQGESDTAGASSTGGETGSTGVATDGGSNTSAPGTATADASTSGGEPTGGETTDAPTTGGQTTGDPPASYEEACMQYCEFIAGCDGGAARGCIDELCQDKVQGGECEGAWVDAFTCFLSLSCAEALKEDSRCMDLLFTADNFCQEPPGTCGEGGFGFGPGACELSEPCPDHARRIFCEEGVCTCFEDDVALAECADRGVCPDIDKVNAAAMACCGWDLLDNEPG